MTKSELLKKLEKYPDNAVVMIQEEGIDCTRDIDDVTGAFFFEDPFEGPSNIPDSEDPEDYDLVEGDYERVVVLS